jgi:hypothetical protein
MQPCPAALLGSLAWQPCTAALQEYYKLNNAGRIASFFTAVGRHAALHAFTGHFSSIILRILSLSLCTN